MEVWNFKKQIIMTKLVLCYGIISTIMSTLTTTLQSETELEVKLPWQQRKLASVTQPMIFTMNKTDQWRRSHTHVF